VRDLAGDRVSEDLRLLRNCEARRRMGGFLNRQRLAAGETALEMR
jgi:hypothetical protein